MGEVAMCRWSNAAALSSQVSVAFLLLSLCWHCSTMVSLLDMKGMEWSRKIGARGGNNSGWYEWLAKPVHWLQCTCHRTVQTKPNIEHTSVGLARACPMKLGLA